MKNKVAIITGAAGGIGRGIAMRYVKEGVKVVIINIDEEAGEKAIKELQEFSPDSIFIHKDLAEHDQLAGIIKQIADDYGQIDILVNNAHDSKLGSKIRID